MWPQYMGCLETITISKFHFYFLYSLSKLVAKLVLIVFLLPLPQAKDEMQERYKSAPKNEKTMISKELVKKVASWGGRFIKLGPDPINGEYLERWYEVSSKVALRKASQALRDINTAEFRDCKRRKYKK